MGWCSWRRGLAPLAVIVLACGGYTGGSAGAAHVHSRFRVTGYASDWTPTATLLRNAPALSDVGIDGVSVTSTGSSVGPPSAGALRLLAVAHASGLRATLLVGNWAPGGTSPLIAARLLTSARNRAHVVFKLVQIARSQGWDGITIDLEALSAGDGPGLVALASALRSALPHGDLLAVDVAAPQSAAGDVAEGYQLPALAKDADIVLMAYDEHGPWSGPGPIGGVPWVERVVNVVRSQVPSARVILGIAAYGYAWRLGARSRATWAVTDEQARRLASSSRRRPRWDRAQGEWTASLRHRTVLWWSGARSYRLRVIMAKRLHLGGVAVWQLASAEGFAAT